jgi:hypothetical protein
MQRHKAQMQIPFRVPDFISMSSGTPEATWDGMRGVMS